MTRADFEPLTVPIPLWEELPGVFRVGKSGGAQDVLIEADEQATEQADGPALR